MRVSREGCQQHVSCLVQRHQLFLSEATVANVQNQAVTNLKRQTLLDVS